MVTTTCATSFIILSLKCNTFTVKNMKPISMSNVMTRAPQNFVASSIMFGFLLLKTNFLLAKKANATANTQEMTLAICNSKAFSGSNMV